MSEQETGAPLHKSAVIPADAPEVNDRAAEATPGAAAGQLDVMAAVDEQARRTLAAVADHLIPAAHGMPSAGEVVGEDRLQFVLRARPDLVEPVQAALRPELGADPAARVEALQRDEPVNLAALQLVIVGGYYTDRQVKELIGYPGQMAIEVRSWEYPPYLEEGLIDAVMARGPVWRDPATGKRAVDDAAPRSYEERTWTAEDRPEGGNDGRDGT
jgi:hypothetical protein